MPEPADTNALVTLARRTLNLTYAETQPYRTSQLRSALRHLAHDILQHLISQGRAFRHDIPDALPGRPEEEVFALGPDPEANALIEQWSDFAFDVGSAEFGPGACEGMSDNVVRILVVLAWKEGAEVRRINEEGRAPSVKEVERVMEP
ncbi:hypothetical protein B0A55_00570 [Friedmanniomyces simplex]|uniref:Uncharacterized protein n=1 Tax=Friedmanniomyces simplex TaxID=329884 RepID=A0A4U0Y2V8_9PEZI|nr:hypothetical protein B0A55_00570 [Friedmanniomyces simplex]